MKDSGVTMMEDSDAMVVALGPHHNNFLMSLKSSPTSVDLPPPAIYGIPMHGSGGVYGLD